MSVDEVALNNEQPISQPDKPRPKIEEPSEEQSMFTNFMFCLNNFSMFATVS